MVRSLAALALYAAVLAAGCVSYTADPLVPDAELREVLARGSAPLAVPVASAAGGWFSVQPDVQLADGLSLDEANALALAYAPAVLAERARQHIAQAQILSAGLLANPEVFVGPRLSTDDAALVVPFSLGFRIPLAGQLGAEKDAASARRDSARWLVMQAELDALHDVRAAFVHAAALHAQRAVLEDVHAQADEVVAWVERLATAGEIDVLTTQLAQLERDELAAEIRARDLELTRATTGVLAAIGLHPSADLALLAPAELLAGGDLPAQDAAAVLRHPALRARAAAHREADGALRVQVARQYPFLTLGPDLEWDDGDLQVGLGVGFPIPLFDRNRGRIEEASEQRRAARAAYRETLLRLAAGEALARREHDAARAHLAAHRAGPLQRAARAGEALAARLRTGHAGVLEALSARRAIARARVLEIELLERVALAALRVQVAGGFVIEEERP